MILFINCCPRTDSNTRRLAGALLEKLGPYDEVDLYERNCEVKTDGLRKSYQYLPLEPLDEDRLNLRTELIEKGDYSHPMFDPTRAFSAADVIVIAAPLWDLSFPSALKVYFENIYITGLTSIYNEKGIPEGLCKATKLYYVSTAGGPYVADYGYNFVESLTVKCFGIKSAELIKAELLDVWGADRDKIMTDAINGIRI